MFFLRFVCLFSCCLIVLLLLFDCCSEWFRIVFFLIGSVFHIFRLLRLLVFVSFSIVFFNDLLRVLLGPLMVFRAWFFFVCFNWCLVLFISLLKLLLLLLFKRFFVCQGILCYFSKLFECVCYVYCCFCNVSYRCFLFCVVVVNVVILFSLFWLWLCIVCFCCCFCSV